MDKEEINDVLAWAKSTDLTEVSFKTGGKGFSFSKTGRPQKVVCRFPSRDLVTIPSPGVGIFQWNEKGKARTVKEGGAVSKGDLLGLLEGAGKPLRVEAPCSGLVDKICIDAGGTAEFGQPLFFIQRKN